MIKIEIQDAQVRAAIERLSRAASDTTPAMRAIAALLKDVTAQNFTDQAGPTGKWAPFKLKPKNKRRTDPKLLQDTARLKNSVVSTYGPSFAQVGTGVVYAAIHQFGGSIERAAYSKLVRHRTDRNANLLTTASFGGKGLIFAKDSHKQAVSRWFEVGAHTVNIPARPFLPFVGSRLQKGVETGILDAIRKHFSGA